MIRSEPLNDVRDAPFVATRHARRDARVFAIAFAKSGFAFLCVCVCATAS